MIKVNRTLNLALNRIQELIQEGAYSKGASLTPEQVTYFKRVAAVHNLPNRPVSALRPFTQPDPSHWDKLNSTRQLAKAWFK